MHFLAWLYKTDSLEYWDMWQICFSPRKWTSISSSHSPLRDLHHLRPFCQLHPPLSTWFAKEHRGSSKQAPTHLRTYWHLLDGFLCSGRLLSGSFCSKNVVAVLGHWFLPWGSSWELCLLCWVLCLLRSRPSPYRKWTRDPQPTSKTKALRLHMQAGALEKGLQVGKWELVILVKCLDSCGFFSSWRNWK